MHVGGCVGTTWPSALSVIHSHMHPSMVGGLGVFCAWQHVLPDLTSDLAHSWQAALGSLPSSADTACTGLAGVHCPTLPD
jgi:hypothetical protein